MISAWKGIMGIFSKTAEYLKERLGKTRTAISNSLSSVLSIGRKIDEGLLDELEETMLMWITRSFVNFWRVKLIQPRKN